MAFREVFHLIFAVIFLFGIYYNLYKMILPDIIKARLENAGGHFKYLTFWNLTLQAAFFFLSLVNDVFGTKAMEPSKRGSLQKFLDVVFASIGFPGATFVFTAFWVLFLTNRELVFPLIFDSFFPTWLNHIMHTLIFPGVMIEMISIYHHYPSRHKSISILAAFTTAYLVWTFIIAYLWGFWTYPVLEILGWWQRLIFMCICVVVVSGFYFIGEMLNRTIWPNAVSRKKARGKKN